MTFYSFLYIIELTNGAFITMFSSLPTYAGFRDGVSNLFSRGDEPVATVDSPPVAEPVPAVVLPIIQAQTRVLSGEYHYDKNLIVLKVEHKKIGADGRDEAPSFEDVCYEVVSLNIKETGSEDPLELLGARTEAAINPLMNELIKSFVGLEDARPLLTTTITQGAAATDAYASAKGQLKSITLPVEQGREPAFDILDTYISKVGKELPHRTQDTLKIPRIQNFEVLRQLLAAASFKSLIHTAKTTHEQSHDYPLTHPTMEDRKEILEEISSALFERRPGGSSDFERLEHISVEECADQQDALLAAQPIFEELERKLKLEIRELERLQQATPNDILNVRLQECGQYLAELKEKIKKIKSELKHTQDLSSLVCFIKEKKVQEQRASFGPAPFTELHSEEWYRKVDALGLLDQSHWEGFKGLSKENQKEKARDVLAENFLKRIPGEFQNFLGELERLQAMLNVEIDRPLDTLSVVGDDASEVSPIQLNPLPPHGDIDSLSELSGRSEASPISDADIEALGRSGSPDAPLSRSPAPLDEPVDWSTVVERTPPPPSAEMPPVRSLDADRDAGLLDARVNALSFVLNRVPMPSAEIAPRALSDAGSDRSVVTVVRANQDPARSARLAALREKLAKRIQQPETPLEAAARAARKEDRRKKREAASSVQAGAEAITKRRLDRSGVVNVAANSRLAKFNGYKATKRGAELMQEIAERADALSADA